MSNRRVRKLASQKGLGKPSALLQNIANYPLQPESHLVETRGRTSTSGSQVSSDELSSPSMILFPNILFFDGRRPCVLVADDNADMREFISSILSPHCDIQEAEDGEKAWQRLQQGDIDLLLSDVQMPAMSGFCLLRHVRSDILFKAMPVILLSARAGEEASVEGLTSVRHFSSHFRFSTDRFDRAPMVRTRET